MCEQKRKRWERLLFSNLLVGQSASRKIAFVGVMTALMVVGNMFFEFKLAETQFSFTIVLSALTGVIIGPLFGFCACFLGDLVGFFYHSAGFAYLPWIGISMGLTALIAGFVINGLPQEKSWFVFIKIGIVCLLSFSLCTVAINTTAFWLLYSKMDYWTYFLSRIFAQGQIWNCLVNYALLFITIPAAQKLKF